jgi:acylphosphatase
VADAEVKLIISGRVQGVGYRIWCRRTAEKVGVKCDVQNLADGNVEAILKGKRQKVEEMIGKCWQGPKLAKVIKIEKID